MQRAFLHGTVPDPAPDGFLRGSADMPTGSWRGKILHAAMHSGVNIFERHDHQQKFYPFQTFIAKGLRDTTTSVLRLNYNISGNPWWLRRIVDELVQVAPGTYLGKVHIRIVPGVSFALGYFRLEK